MGTAVAATPNFLIQEMCSPYVANLDKYTEHDWHIANGYINVIDGPGLGLEVKKVDIATVPTSPWLTVSTAMLTVVGRVGDASP